MTKEKVRFTVSMSPIVAAELERVRGTASRSLVVEAMLVECLDLPEEVMAAGRRHYNL